MQVEFRAPASAMPKPDPENPCACQFRPFQLKEKSGQLFWLVSAGDRVEKDQDLCEAEVEKKTIVFPSPASGVIAKLCVGSGDSFTCGDLLALIESEDEEMSENTQPGTTAAKNAEQTGEAPSGDIDLYLITGFLGSGKTTFLQNLLLAEDASRTGVLVNEYGSVGIDAQVLADDEVKMVEINNGSIFCACLKGGFVKTLAAFLEQPVDRLLVEASGMADPSSIEALLAELEPLIQKKNHTDRRYRYRGSVCIVDAQHFADLYEALLPPVNQVKKSGLLVLNKTDLVDKKELAEVEKILGRLNPQATIYRTSFAKVPLAVLRDHLSGEVEDVGESLNTEWNRPFSCIVEMPGTYAHDDVLRFLVAAGEKVFRAKGFFSTGRSLYYVSGVGRGVTTTALPAGAERPLHIAMISNGQDDMAAWLAALWKEHFGSEIALRED